VKERKRQKARIIVAAMACLLALCWVSAALAFTAQYARCKTNDLEVFQDSTGNVILMHLMDGDVVWVAAESGNGDSARWRVDLKDKNGKDVTGWVKAVSTNFHFDPSITALANTKEAPGAPADATASPSPSASSAPGGGTSTGSTTTTTATATTVYRNLKVGSSGEDVRRLQQRLKDLKHFTGSVTGTFGTQTQAAVRAYQKSAGLTVDGIAGPITQARLFGAAGSGSSSGASSSGSRYSDQAITRADKVNLRNGPSTSNASRASLPRNTRVTIRSNTRKGTELWYNVSVNGIVGYIRSDMLRILTWEEAGGSGDSGGGSGGGSAPPPTVYRNLRSGNTGADVRALQEALRGLGYTRVNVNGTYDARTLDAVRDFQKKNGLVADGIAGPLTQAAVFGASGGGGSSGGSTTPGSGGDDRPTDAPPPTTFRILKNGSSGEDVRAMQQKLKDLGYYTGSVTGTFGTLTENAVRAFQRANNLKVDGVAGVDTQTKLYSIVTGSGSTANPTINGVDMVTWQVFYDNYRARYTRGDKAILTDARTNRSFTIVCQSMSATRHLDAEPATANDTAVLRQIFGGTITYHRRPVWLTMSDGKTYAASLYGVPHGASFVSGNNFDGQLCVHMLGSHTNAGNSVCPDHQKAIEEAYRLAPNR